MLVTNVQQIIRQLQLNKLNIWDIPEEVCTNKDVLRAERELGLRKELNRGFDVIHSFFFVEEELFYKNSLGKLIGENSRTTFDTLEEYYDYLDGDIYENACYKYCNFTKYRDFINKKKIDSKLLLERQAFSEETIDDAKLEISQEEIIAYDKVEENRRLIRTWINSFEACTSGYDLEVAVRKYNKSKLQKVLDVSFFFYYYIFRNVRDKKKFNAIMEFMCTGSYPEHMMINALCSIYNPYDVIRKYDYSGGTKQTNYKRKKALREYVKLLNTGEIKFKSRGYFDNKSHYFCEETEGFEAKRRLTIVRYQRYFETFEEFIEYRKGNLKGVDLSGAIMLDVDFSLYEIDESTKLPVSAVNDVCCEITKGYQDDFFYVCKEWKTKRGSLVKENKFVTKYFFDFVHYLKGDLTNSFLLFCDGLENLVNFEGIDFTKARMTSKMCDKFGIAYESYDINRNAIGSFAVVEKNEKETLTLYSQSNDVELFTKDEDILWEEYNRNSQRISYITDIHLMHRLQNANCRSKDDVNYVIHNIVNNIVSKVSGLLLIGGDVSSDFSVFVLFLRCLKWQLECKKYGKIEVVFVLGNHELWEFPKVSIDEIAAIYKRVIEESGMHLLQNEILYQNNDGKFCEISYNNLICKSTKELRTQIQSASIVILGGLGFSGYNEEFNANQKIYRETLDRAGEIAESKKFEELYNRVLPCICDKNAIIFTHTPQKDWNADAEPCKNLIYVSGHTHRNVFYDDGDYRIYSDNQIGYRNENPHVKYFLMDRRYDIFSDYEDGVYKITRDQYNDFYRGKNIRMDFNREVYVLYMLKKGGYYCFITEARSGSLSILNGGAMRRLEESDVNYYYIHMDEVILYIENPLSNYMNMQKKISEEVKKIGGTGTIHGCIIDIDWFNHIYVNPVDLTITGYWALDMINKIVYPNVPALLEARCPAIHNNYLKLIKGDKKSVLMNSKRKGELGVLPQRYLRTDIYEVSREIKKMQKLTSNILCAWYEEHTQGNAIANECEKVGAYRE